MANPAHVDLVRGGAAAVAQFVRENPGTPLDLEGADLSGLDLEGCLLGEANLVGANLSGTNLRRANLGGANLRGADLRNADVRDTALHRARLQEADLRGISLEAIGVGRQLMCASAATFENSRWDRERLEEILRILNLNKDWEIRYEIVAKPA